MIRVSVNGYGSIGKRVAEAVVKHDKLELVGVSKYTPDKDVKLANLSGINVFTPDKEKFNDADVAGTLDEMIQQSDIIVDASPDGKGVKNKSDIYVPNRKAALFQGGEDESIAEMSFNARSNFSDARNKDYIRVVSCNTTSYCRIIKPLSEHYNIDSAEAFLIRRGSDPADTKGSQLNSVEWKAKSHHAHDINTVIRDVKINSMAFKVPHTLFHVNSLLLRFNSEAPTKDDVAELFRKEGRVAVLNTASNTSEVMEIARDLGLKRYDTFVVSLLMNTFTANKNEAFVSFLVPQESIVIPENIDAIVARFGLMKQDESMKHTNEILGIPKIKSDLERVFG